MCKTAANTEVHMEKGPIGRTLLAYTVPVLLSQIFLRFKKMQDSTLVTVDNS